MKWMKPPLRAQCSVNINFVLCVLIPMSLIDYTYILYNIFDIDSIGE